MQYPDVGGAAVRLTDFVLRQGHLSEQALTEALLTGERPAHLDRCDLCAERAVVLGRWLDDVRRLGHEAADAVFTPERLQAQQAQILRRLEQVDQPARVISFPVQSRPAAFDANQRRLSPVWVGAAVAASLVAGVVGGRWSVQLEQANTAQALTPPRIEAPMDAGNAVGPQNVTFPDRDLEDLRLDGLMMLDEFTPTLTMTRVDRAGG
jgi:hypothetical protein